MNNIPPGDYTFAVAVEDDGDVATFEFPVSLSGTVT